MSRRAVIQEKINTFRQVALYYIEELFTYTHVKIYTGLALATNIFLWGMEMYIVSIIDEERIALHYTVDFGIDYFGQYEKIYIMPFLGLVIFGLNLGLSAVMARSRDIKLISHMLLASALIANWLLVAASASVYLINVR